MKSEVIIRNLQSEVIRTGSHKQDYHALTTLTTNEVITTLTTIKSMLTKHIIRLALCLPPLCIAASCTSDVTAPDAAPTPFPGISTIYAENMRTPETRAVAGTQTVADAEAGIRAQASTRAVTLPEPTYTRIPTNASIGIFIYGDNRKAQYNKTTGKWEPETAYNLTGSTHIGVYSPYTPNEKFEDIGADGMFYISPSLYSAEKDLMCGHAEVNSQMKDISIAMSHVFTRLSITLVKSELVEYAGTSKLTKLKVSGDNIIKRRHFIPSLAWYNNGPDGYTPYETPALDLTITGTDPTSSKYAVKVDLLLVPEITGDYGGGSLDDATPADIKPMKDVILTATVDGKDMTVVIPAAKFIYGLFPGVQYNVVLNLKPKSLELVSLQTEEWDTATTKVEDNGATLEEDPGPINN